MDDLRIEISEVANNLISKLITYGRLEEAWEKSISNYVKNVVSFEEVKEYIDEQTKTECKKCKELNEKFGNEHYVATCDRCLDKRLEEII